MLVTQSCLTLCYLMDFSPPGSSLHGIFQARILKRVAICPSGDLPNSGIEPRSLELQADSLPCSIPITEEDSEQNNKGGSTGSSEVSN